MGAVRHAATLEPTTVTVVSAHHTPSVKRVDGDHPQHLPCRQGDSSEFDGVDADPGPPLVGWCEREPDGALV
jgi:hypothetical protein